MKYFGKFIKNSCGEQLQLSNDVAYNNVMTNLGKIFNYDWFESYPDSKYNFEEFIRTFTDWLLDHQINVGEYKNMDFDVHYYLEQFVMDKNTDKLDLMLYYDAVYKWVKSEYDTVSDDFDYFADILYPSEFGLNSGYLRSEYGDEYGEDVVDDIYEAVSNNTDDIGVYKSDDLNDDLFVVNEIDLRNEEPFGATLDLPVPFEQENDFALKTGTDSVYWDYNVQFDEISVSYDGTLYYAVSKEFINEILGKNDFDGIETLFNSRRIFSSDELFYHSTRQRGLSKFNDKTDNSNAFTGEGAMVHGWGLYLQSDRRLNTENYKLSLERRNKSTTVPDSITIDGEKFVFDRDRKFWECVGTYKVYAYDSVEALSLNSILVYGDVDKVINDLQKYADSKSCPKRKLFPKAMKFIKAHTFTEIIPRHRDKGVSQYEVLVSDDMVFIVDEQIVPDWILEKITPQSGLNIEDYRGLNGRQFYESMSKELGGDEYTSNYLASIGIDGKKYVGGSDGYCCVIFNCSKLKIVKEM